MTKSLLCVASWNMWRAGSSTKRVFRSTCLYARPKSNKAPEFCYFQNGSITNEEGLFDLKGETKLRELETNPTNEVFILAFRESKTLQLGAR